MMKSKLFTIGLIAILAVGLITAVPLTHTFAKSNKEKKARDAIVKALDRATEGKPSTIDMLNISKFNDTSTIVVINKTGGTVTPPSPTPTPKCLPTEHIENGKCVPNAVPTGNTTTVCAVGDFKDGKVMDAMKKAKCNTTVALGDMGYGKDLKLLKSLGFTKCVVGNHDAAENGSPAIYKEALAYCQDHWSMLIGNKTTLLLGINTNGKEADTTAWVTSIMGHLSDTVKNVIFFSHKGGHVFPNAHHGAEAASIYSKIEDAGHANVKIYEINGHNHNYAKASNGLWFIVGTGGAKKYTCGTNAEWPICDTTTGFLKLTIDGKGKIADGFYDTSGKKVN